MSKLNNKYEIKKLWGIKQNVIGKCTRTEKIKIKNLIIENINKKNMKCTRTEKIKIKSLIIENINKKT